MFSLALLAAVYLSMATAVHSSTLTLLWLPTSIVLVGLLTRGLSVLLPAAIGTAIALWLLEAPGWRIGSAVAAVVLAPLVASWLIQRLRARRRAVSHLLQTVHIIVAVALIQAPISALILFIGCYLDPEHSMGPGALIAAHWIVEATSGIVFVRGLLSWMPDDGSGFCPVAGMARSQRRIQPDFFIPLALIFAFCAGAFTAFWLGQSEMARLASIPIFIIAATSSLISNRRIASAVLMIATLAIAIICTYAASVSTELLSFGRLVEVELLLLTGGLLLQLLNSLVEERLAQQRQLRRKAFANEVTNLPNLRALSSYLASSALAQRLESEGLLMAEVSVSGLSRWGDIAGRASIMIVEREIGVCLRDRFGKRMRYLIHIGTGRFILVLAREQTSEDIVSTMTACFLDHRFSIAGNPVKLNYSIGVVDVPAGVHDLETMLASLSIAQQHAARNGDHYYRLTMNDAQVDAYRQNLAWVEKIRSRLASNSIVLYAQPIVPSHQNSESALHFEVLARMTDDDGSILTPDQFLPAISMAGLQIEFDRAVISRALHYLGSEKELASSISLCAINVTGPTICDPRFPAFLIGSLQEQGVSAKKITIEVTESDAIADLESALENIAALAVAEVNVAVDDFGTGQATFEYIRRMKPNMLKIDGSFVRRYADDALDKEIVQSIVRMAKVIGASTVAEFVETEQVAQEMRMIGVDFLQGWAIGKPVPIESIQALSDARRSQTLAMPDYQV